jgi:RNA polymerase sigma-70 factor (ECF subfamily)
MNAERIRFEAMFRQHYGAVLRYATRRVGTDGANEIVAETFLTAWRRFDQVPDPSLPWLYGTARRLVANELRRRARAARLGERIQAQPRPESADPAELVPQRLLVAAALESLSERDREVLRLTEWEQLGPAEVAVVLGCSNAAAKVRVHRARKRFGLAIGAIGTDAAHHMSLLPSGESA